MLRTSESETEILLGNKQLLGIFFVVAVLLGVAFTGGYLVGRGGTGKHGTSTETATVAKDEVTATAPATGGQTRTLEGEPSAPTIAAGGADVGSSAVYRNGTGDEPAKSDSSLGRKRSSATSNTSAKPSIREAEFKSSEEGGYVPQSGAQYLQVAAVGRDEAEAVADVLHRKGFRAHAVPKPGNPKLYRVIIGPVKDAGDLSSTREALRKSAGFREVIVQKY